MLVACTECNEKISDKARRCPRCGAPNIHRKSGVGRFFKKAFLVFLVIVGLAVAIAPFTKPSRESFETMLHKHLVYKLSTQEISEDDSFARKFLTIGCKLSTPRCAELLRERMKVELHDYVFAVTAEIISDNGVGRCLGVFGRWLCIPPPDNRNS